MLETQVSVEFILLPSKYDFKQNNYMLWCFSPQDIRLLQSTGRIMSVDGSGL